MTTNSEGSSLLAQFSNALADAIAQVGESIVSVSARPRRTSSGIHWQPGIIITADYTIKHEEDITVTLPNGEIAPVTLVGRDAGTDIAVLRIEGDRLPTVSIKETTELKVGHLVMALGRSSENGLGASMGVISAMSGSWRSWEGGQIDQFVRPDLTLYPGFPGGPLVTPESQVVGMNTTGPRNLVLTIPTKTIQRVVNQILQKGRITRGYLGVGMQPVRLPENLVRSLNLPNANGVIFVSVEPGSPAERAGFLIGDVLVALGESAIADIRDVFVTLDPDRVGTTLMAKIIRGGQLLEVPVAVGERPSGNC